MLDDGPAAALRAHRPGGGRQRGEARTADRPSTVTLASHDGHAVLTVQDDGAGFDPAGVFASARGHFGLLGMRERARRMGGEVSVTSAVQKGTTVEVRVPQS